MAVLLVDVDDTTCRGFYEYRYIVHPHIPILIIWNFNQTGIGRQDAANGNITVIGDGIGRVLVNIGDDRLRRIDFADAAQIRIAGVRFSLNTRSFFRRSRPAR